MTSNSCEAASLVHAGPAKACCGRRMACAARLSLAMALVLSLGCAVARSATRRSLGATAEPSEAEDPGGVAHRARSADCRAGVRVAPAASSACRRDVLRAARRASSTVLALTRENTPAIPGAAHALDALAEAVRALGGDDPVLHAALARVDRDVVLLENCDDLDPGAAEWVRDGVLASLDAIGRVASYVRPESVDPWTDDARAAALAIDKGWELAFQRAVVQEAFRTTADALRVVSRAASHCEASATVARAGAPGEFAH